MSDELREEQAKRLLNDKLFNEAFDVLRKDLMGRWEASGSSELEARESILSLIHISEPTRLGMISYAVFC